MNETRFVQLTRADISTATATTPSGAVLYMLKLQLQGVEQDGTAAHQLVQLPALLMDRDTAEALIQGLQTKMQSLEAHMTPPTQAQ